MQPRVRVASLALLALALVHLFWGVRMLLASNVLGGGAQLVGAGGLVVAAVAAGHRARGGLALGFGVAATAAALRALPMLASPFGGATLLLAAGFGAAAAGAWRLAARPDDLASLALRGGAFAAAAAYAAFLGLNAVFDGPGLPLLDFAGRAVAMLLFAATIDAPPRRERKAFAGGPSSADG